MSAAAFSALQTRCLDAMGYTRHVLVGATDQATALSMQTEISTATAPSGSARKSNASPQPRAAFALPANADARDSKLIDAILNAARRPADALADPLVWLQGFGVPSLNTLRTNPAAKRALWMRLRAERRAR